ncbi:MAG: hypothetical protein J6Y83_06605 [Bacteroidales bacterium]|nr:hypothetical protein [Bacteroidales bacterium]
MDKIENCGKRSISEWARYYREFVRRQRFLGRWPLTDGERKTAWREWKLHSLYDVAE